MKNEKIVVCLYGAARETIDEVYKDAAYELGQEIAKAGYIFSFGAGSSGIMGACARGVDSRGGYTIGVTPHFMHKFEPIYECSEIMECRTMGDRKETLERISDAFIVGPGGIGTMDEFFQIITLKELGQLDKPIILFNVEGYFDKLVDTLQTMLESGFLRRNAMSLFRVANTPQEVLFAIEEEFDKGLEIQYLKDLYKDGLFVSKIAPSFYEAFDRLDNPGCISYEDAYEKVVVSIWSKFYEDARHSYDATDKSVSFGEYVDNNQAKLEADFNQKYNIDNIIQSELDIILCEIKNYINEERD